MLFLPVRDSCLEVYVDWEQSETCIRKLLVDRLRFVE